MGHAGSEREATLDGLQLSQEIGARLPRTLQGSDDLFFGAHHQRCRAPMSSAGRPRPFFWKKFNEILSVLNIVFKKGEKSGRE